MSLMHFCQLLGVQAAWMLSESCQPQQCRFFLASLTRLGLDTEAERLQKHMAEAQAQAAARLAVTARQGTWQSYSGARSGALAFGSDLTAALEVCPQCHCRMRLPVFAACNWQMHMLYAMRECTFVCF